MKISLPAMLLRITVFTVLLQAMASHADLHLSVLDNWRTLEDDRFSVNYKKQDKALAEKTLAIARQVLPQIEQFLHWQVSTRIYINLIDSQDDPNGWAMVVPYNHVTVYTTPPTLFSEMNDYQRWMRMLLTHELTHIVHIDMAQGAPLALRKVFGRFPLLFPNQLQPRLFTEGLATYVETDWQRAAGRGQSPYFNMMMRTEVENGLLPLGEAQQAREEWPLNHAYLYGVFFYQFLESKYGKDSIPAYVGEYSSDLIPFMLSEPSRRVANKTIKALWDEYLAWLENRFRPQINRIKAQGISGGTQLTHNGFYTSRPLLLENGDMVYVGISAQSASTMQLRTASGKEYALGKVKADARLVGIADGYVYFLQSSPCKDNLLFDELYRVALNKADSVGSSHLNLAEKISSCKRYTHAELSIDKKTLALVRSRTGTQQLVLMPLATRKQQIVWQGELNQYIARPVWIDSENLLVSRKEPDASWQLYRFNIPQKQWQLLSVDLPDGNRQMPFYSVQENALYFTSDNSGVYDIYRSNTDGSHAVRITRSLGGSVDPVVANGQLYYAGYSASGWDIYSIKPDSLPVDNTAADGSVLPVQSGNDNNNDKNKGMIINWNNDDNLDSNVPVSDHKYSAFPALWPTSWFIGSQSTGDAMELGVQVSGNDPLYLHSYLLGIAYDINLQKTSAVLEYVFDTHVFLGYRHAYEITGNDEPVLAPEFAINSYITRDDWQAAVQHTWPFDYVNITPFIAINHTGEAFTDRLGSSGYLELERKITTSGVGFIYDSAEYYLQGISASNGRTIKLSLENDRVQRAFAKHAYYGYSDLGGTVAAFDWREYIDISNRHVMALHYFRGEGSADTDPFQLRSSQGMTAFTQQYVHERDIRLRGYPDSLRELTDINAELYSAEWRFPLWDIYQGIAGWPLGAHSVHGALFYDAGAVWGTLQNPQNYGRRHIYDSAGIELKTDVDLAYSLLPLQAGVGFAQPLRETEQGKSAEVYITLSAMF